MTPADLHIPTGPVSAFIAPISHFADTTLADLAGAAAARGMAACTTSHGGHRQVGLFRPNRIPAGWLRLNTSLDPSNPEPEAA